jgi:glutaconyl-CoA decarboxylase
MAVEVEPSPGHLIVRAGGEAAAVRLEQVAGSECWRLEAGGRTMPVRIKQEAGQVLVTVGAVRVPVTIRRALPIPSRRPGAGAGADRLEVRAPMPGLVVEVPCEAGAGVRAGGAVAIVEAMKMQMEVPAPASGVIEEVRVRTGQEVAGGQVLAVIRVASPAAAGEAGL